MFTGARFLVIFFAFCEKLAWTCNSGNYDGGERPPNAPEDTTKPLINITKNHPSGAMSQPDGQKRIDSAWGGFEVPDDMQKKWKQWLNDYNERRLREYNNTNDPSFYDERGPNSDWPPSWQGLGAGQIGHRPEPPPPWAYAPVNKGLPAQCYLPLVKGECNETLERWAFNPYTERCIQFIYTGCNGTKNNFHTQLGCEEKCTLDYGTSGCESETDISMEKLVLRKSGRKCG